MLEHQDRSLLLASLKVAIDLLYHIIFPRMILAEHHHLKTRFRIATCLFGAVDVLNLMSGRGDKKNRN